jgi:oxygen-dependent protoporphyrinogen oxidase
MLMAPTMILPFLRSRLVSWFGKLRVALELFIPSRLDGVDESLAAFVRRRLGSEMLDRIAAPLMAGIHAADPERLSLRSTFPMFADMERNHGSITRAMFHRKRSAKAAPSTSAPPAPKPQPMFVSLDRGLQLLPNALAATLAPHQLHLNTRVESLSTQPDGSFLVHLADGSTLPADHVVLATPAFISAAILEPIAPLLASKLRDIPYVSTATVSLAFRRDQLHNVRLQGLGFLVPSGEGHRINACTWSSTKFAHRAPSHSILLRVFIGGALNQPLAEQDDEALIQLAREELRDILGLTSTPILARAFRWRNANPQYHVGHQDLIAEIEHLASAHPGLHLTGAAFHGAGIPDCVQQAKTTALRIATDQAHARAHDHSHESLLTA